MQRFELQWGDATGDATVIDDDAQPVALWCSPVPDTVGATLLIGGDDLGAPSMRLGEATWEWQWQPRGRVGRHAARLRLERRRSEPVVLRSTLIVQPGKIDAAAYEELLDAVQCVAAGLVLDLTGGGIPAASMPADARPRSVIEDYWTRVHVEATVATDAAERLMRGAYDTWQHQTEERELHDAAKLSGDILARMAERPLEETNTARLADGMRGVPWSAGQKPRLPRTLPVRVAEPTARRYEHAVLARVLLELHARCLFVRDAIARELAWRGAGRDSTQVAKIVVLEEWLRQVHRTASVLQRARTLPFLAEVEPMRVWKGVTELMRRDRRYRVIAQAWFALWKHPFVAVHTPAFDLPVDDLPSLYERWCVLEVLRALATVGEPLEQRLVESDHGTGGVALRVWNVQLREGAPLLRRRGTGVEWRVWYHRRFEPRLGQGEHLGSLDPFLRVPDVVVEIIRPGRPPRLVIFDAKYRLNATGSPGEDVLETAYAYHGGLGYAGTPASIGTFILFPGAEGFEAGGVGAVPMVPGRASPLPELVQRLLDA